MFTNNQLNELRQQMQAHFQIIVQVYVLQREIYTQQHHESQYWEGMLKEISMMNHDGTVQRIGSIYFCLYI